MNIKYPFVLATMCMVAPLAFAGLDSIPPAIKALQPYMADAASGEARIYLSVDSDAFWATNVFSIDNTHPELRQAYATALSALLAGKKNKCKSMSARGGTQRLARSTSFSNRVASTAMPTLAHSAPPYRAAIHKIISNKH